MFCTIFNFQTRSRNAASEKKVVYNSGINAGINMPFLYIFYKGNI